jgi:hypothetical protein
MQLIDIPAEERRGHVHFSVSCMKMVSSPPHSASRKESERHMRREERRGNIHFSVTFHKGTGLAKNYSGLRAGCMLLAEQSIGMSHSLKIC